MVISPKTGRRKSEDELSFTKHPIPIRTSQYAILIMYKRDLITAEIEKLAQVLARIMGN